MRYVAPIIATLLSLSACLSKPPTQPFACSVGVSWSADPDFKPNEKRTIEAGLQIWSSGTDGRVCFYEGGDQVRFFRVERQAELCPFDSGCMAHVGLHSAGRIWLVMGEMLSERYMLATVVHETGHALGLPHRNDGGCMEAQVNQRCVADGKLPKSDYAAFCALHGCQK